MSLVDKITKVMGQGNTGIGPSRNEATVIPGSGITLAKPRPLEEIGVSGLLRTKGIGYTYEDPLRDLSTYRAKQIYREMRDNDAVIGSMFFALEMILRRAEWRVEPADTKLGEKRAKFLNECMEDMSHTWEDFIAECVNMFVFGFALFETVYKRRQGQGSKTASKFDDGLIGWRKHAPRAQESILYWIWDDEGGLQGAVQLAAPDYKTVPMPIEKLLLFRTTSLKNNPEGRALDPETPIPTPDGWRKLDSIFPGAKVFDEQGRVRYVTARKDWKNRPSYKITFNDRTSIIADENHLWKTQTANERGRGVKSKLRTTKEIRDSVKATTGTSNHSIDWTQAIDYPEQILPLDPYFLGYWLGNGSSGTSGVSCHAQDAEEIAELITACGYQANIQPNGDPEGNGRSIHVLGQRKWDSSGPQSVLRTMGLIQNKHIPQNYLRGSIDQRLMLLAGLMDSDGAIDPWGRCSFSNTNYNLITGVAEVLRSLGVQAYITDGRPPDGISHKLPSWGVKFSSPWSPFRLKRKAARVKGQSQRSAYSRMKHYIVSVEPVSKRRTVCIEVDSPSHMYLAGESMIPTHNSVLRNSYRSWVFKRRIEEVEAIGIERDLCGLPILYASSEALEAMGGEEKARRLVTNIRIDDQAGVILPIAYDDKGKELVKLELLKAAGSKQTDPSKTIGRYNADMLNTILAGFVAFGQGAHGSRALHISATQIFTVAIAAFMDSIAAVMNRIAIPRLFILNRFDPTDAPKLVPGEVGYRDLDELASYIAKLAAAGLTFFDKDTSDYLRKVGRLPDTPEDLTHPDTGIQPNPLTPAPGTPVPAGVEGSAGHEKLTIPGATPPPSAVAIPALTPAKDLKTKPLTQPQIDASGKVRGTNPKGVPPKKNPAKTD